MTEDLCIRVAPRSKKAADDGLGGIIHATDCPLGPRAASHSGSYARSCDATNAEVEPGDSAREAGVAMPIRSDWGMARISPVEEPYEPEVAERLKAMMPGDQPPIALFRTFVRNLPMTKAMGPWGGYELGRRLSLTLRDREIVIDRTTARCRCEYEWGVHVAFFADAAALTREQVGSLTHGSADDECWTDDRDGLLIEAVDQLHDSGTIDDALGHGSPRCSRQSNYWTFRCCAAGTTRSASPRTARASNGRPSLPPSATTEASDVLTRRHGLLAGTRLKHTLPSCPGHVSHSGRKGSLEQPSSASRTRFCASGRPGFAAGRRIGASLAVAVVVLGATVQRVVAGLEQAGRTGAAVEGSRPPTEPLSLPDGVIAQNDVAAAPRRFCRRQLPALCPRPDKGITDEVISPGPTRDDVVASITRRPGNTHGVDGNQASRSANHVVVDGTRTPSLPTLIRSLPVAQPVRKRR